MPRGLACLLCCVCLMGNPERFANAEAPDSSDIVRVENRPVVIPRTEQFDVRAKSGLEYRIFLAVPTGELSAAGVPVIYLTDANSNFPILLAAAQRQIRETLPAVIVGIGYPTDDLAEIRRRRSVDLTPPTSSAWAAEKAKPFADLETGGNDRFCDFLEQELKPLIEKKYPVDRRRQTLFGHSFGGLFVLHVLFNRPESFKTYLASSPSLWWNDSSILQEEAAFLKKYAGQRVPARLLITVGEMEQPPLNAHPRQPVRRGPPGRTVDETKQLATRLSAAQLDGLQAELRIFAEESHGSVVLPAASRGVRFSLENQP